MTYAYNSALAEKQKSTLLPQSLPSKKLDNVPINVMACDPQTFVINYANATTRTTLNSITHLLPKGVTGDNIVGQSIDIFHKVPSYQRKLLSDPKNLPHKAIIRLGPEALELNISSITKRGKIDRLMLTWSIVTERENLKQMVDLMPINVMMCDPVEFKINYLNETSKKTLKSIEHLLPIKAEEVLGACIDIFHKMPSHQRKILGDPKNLPYSSNIKLGDQVLRLEVAAIVDARGFYVGPMVSWSVITEQQNLANRVQEVAKSVASTSTELQSTAQTLSATAEETSHQASAVAAASEEASANVQTVAAAAEELANTIQTVGDQVKTSAQIAKTAVADSAKANKTIAGLNEVASKIGAVVQLITDIAEQTNLLALNATIEAARAGDAGKGFAVVASEVKSLASQTGKATEEIARQITEIQNESANAVQAIRSISDTITKMDDIAGLVLQAVSEQSQATAEIAKNVQQAATGTSEVSNNITGVQQAASETGSAAHQTLGAAKELSGLAVQLEKEITAFMKK